MNPLQIQKQIQPPFHVRLEEKFTLIILYNNSQYMSIR
jgi:hypothetical protein